MANGIDSCNGTRFCIGWKINILFNSASLRWIEHQFFTLCEILYHDCMIYHSPFVCYILHYMTLYALCYFFHPRYNSPQNHPEGHESNSFQGKTGLTEMPTVPFLPYLLRFFIENTALRFFLIKYVFLKFWLYMYKCEGECTKSLQKHVHQLLVSRMCVCAVR